MLRAEVTYNSGHEVVIECEDVAHAFNGLEIFNQVTTASGEKIIVAIPVKEISMIKYKENNYE